MIPDILLVSSLFWEDGDLKLPKLKFMDPIYDKKLFIDREFYEVEGGIFKKSLEEVKSSAKLKGIKSIGILFLSTISDENSVRFIDIIDRELKYLVKHLKNLVDILRTDPEEFDSLKVLEDLLDSVEEVRGYLGSLAEDISELHNKMKQIAENEDSFANKINKIVEKCTYIPEFFIISRIQNGIGSSEAK